MAKAKAGKKSKVKKAGRSRKAAPQAQVPAVSYPCTVLVKKGSDSLPVQVSDEAHLKRLQEEFGANHVEVQS